MSRLFPRRLAALLVPLLLLGCTAATPPRVVAAPISYPPAARDRMLRLVVAEWQEWGALTVMDGDRPAQPGPEGDPANLPRLLAYWRAVAPDDEGAVALLRARYAEALAGRPGGAALGRQPFWSAAFVSFVLRAAGVDAAEFPPAPAHATYVDALIAQAERFPSAAPFVPHLPIERAPVPGDLICADRGPAPLRDWRERAADRGRFRPMHCDIVVDTMPGHVAVIGGNVADTVARTLLRTDAEGRLLPRPAGQPVPFCVFENRLGRLPPWQPAAPPVGSPLA